MTRCYANPAPPYPGFLIRVGARGDYVRQIQTCLNRNGANLNADGVFGSLTENAVRNFQRSVGLNPDGIVGQLTWNALMSRCGFSTQSGQVTGRSSVLSSPEIIENATIVESDDMDDDCDCETTDNIDNATPGGFQNSTANTNFDDMLECPFGGTCAGTTNSNCTQLQT